jgi:hypothetical protein
MNLEIFYPNERLFFWGKYQINKQEGVLAKSHASCTGICPVPSYRATYLRRFYNLLDCEIIIKQKGQRSWGMEREVRIMQKQNAVVKKNESREQKAESSKS